jgi:hypothetical protein
MARSYKSKGARLTAVKTGRRAEPSTRSSFDNDNREVLRQTRAIHKLETKRRQIKRKLAELTKELRARRRGLRDFVREIATKTYDVELDSQTTDNQE